MRALKFIFMIVFCFIFSLSSFAEINFLAILNEYIEEVPDEYKQEIIDFLQEKYQMANNEGGKKYYQDMINRINFNF